MSDEGTTFVAFGSKLNVTQSWASSALEKLRSFEPNDNEDTTLVALSLDSELVYFGWNSNEIVRILLESLSKKEIEEKIERKKHFELKEYCRNVEDEFRVFIIANAEKIENDYYSYREERKEIGKKPVSRTKWINSMRKSWLKSRLMEYQMK